MSAPSLAPTALCHKATRPARRRQCNGAGCWAAARCLLGGCGLGGDSDHDGPDAPVGRAAGHQSRSVAWVFGSGGPRGFVHVGVIKALQELGCNPI